VVKKTKDIHPQISQMDADNKIQNEKLERLRGLAGHLRGCIKGQEPVIGRVVSVLQRGELGLAHHGRPKGSFLFVGPTG
jgi:ATP-dependent Clp protease ATP-binding subunit ClpB